ncbi:hypothetical protein DPMN_009774 [Dreissena polymorpha]|uniref:Uncharacterized protein n=1 Tax=Dreissena polymorpha TaxID=45954 RepID=A0A9D4N117_DREPO|nr:hypothetical protein DPMN_009774 [Dreissena polymorpha]
MRKKFHSRKFQEGTCMLSTYVYLSGYCKDRMAWHDSVRREKLCERKRILWSVRDSANTLMTFCMPVIHGTMLETALTH